MKLSEPSGHMMIVKTPMCGGRFLRIVERRVNGLEVQELEFGDERDATPLEPEKARSIAAQLAPLYATVAV